MSQQNTSIACITESALRSSEKGTKVLEHGHQVQFGRCTYLYSRGDAITTGNFQLSFWEFMKLYDGHQ